VASVHPTAVVDPAAKLADDATVGPYVVVGGEVTLSSGVVVGPHAVLVGRTEIGARSRVFPFCVIGELPQILGATAGAGLTIGADNVIREYVSIHSGSAEVAEPTRIGDANLLMSGAHVAHDCRIGSHCVLSTQASLAGHVVVEDHAVVGAQVGIHQFCRIGASSFVGASGKLNQDVAPFGRVVGRRPRSAGANEVGMRRRGFSEEKIDRLRRAHHLLFRSRLRRVAAVERVRSELGSCAEVDHLLRFVESSARGVTR